MPKVVTIFGGIHPTAVPEIVLKEKEVDCVAIGEAENSLLAFLRECSIEGRRVLLPHHPIKGMVFKVGGEFIGDYKEGELPDLNSLPFPYKKPLYSHFKSFSHDYYIITSRGCPYICSYCFNSYIRCLRGTSIIRQRTVDNVIDEILQIKRDYSPKYITFHDDCFTADDGWIMEFCQRYKKEINLPFSCLAIPEYLNKDKIKALSEAGCYHVEIGVQSFSEELRKGILHRNCDNAKTADAIRMLKYVGILVRVDHMLGIPEDTLKIEEESALFYNQLRPHIINVLWLTYYPKTAIVDIAKQKGILNAQDIENINEGYALTKESLHTGGSIKNPGPYFGICLLLNYIPLLPKWLVRFLIKRKLYNRFSTKNPAIFKGLPRLLLAILYRKNFCDRAFIIKAFNKFFLADAF
jgi:radical SAM superfamily enzyme YgiQ (UPF0313 family)